MRACPESTHPDRPQGPGLNPRAFERAHRFIMRNLGEKLSLADIAAEACMSRFHFARLFRRSTGQSPMAYVSQLRVERAKELLARGNERIASTAASLGFFDQSHFNRAFRRATGVSPKTFMRQCRPGATARTCMPQKHATPAREAASG